MKYLCGCRSGTPLIRRTPHMKIYQIATLVLFLSANSIPAFSSDVPSTGSTQENAASSTGSTQDNAVSSTDGTADNVVSSTENATDASTSLTANIADSPAGTTQADPPSPAENTAGAKTVPTEPTPVESTSQTKTTADTQPRPSEKIATVDISPTGTTAQAALTQSVAQNQPAFRDDYKRNRIMQTTGLSLLGASALMILAGAAIVEAAPWGPVSKAGISFIGIGLAHFITSAFLLGFSKAVVIQELPPVRPLRIIHKAAFYKAQNGDIYF
jgi:hypothetical protein